MPVRKIDYLDYMTAPSASERLKQSLSSKINETLERAYRLCEGKTDLAPEISRYLLSSGGKRLRPLLTLACADLCGYNGTADVSLAVAVEFMHTATLLHDDVVDNSALRRGKPAAHTVWSNKESVLVGDFLLGRAFDLMADAQSLRVYRLLSEAAVIITEGEILQLQTLKAGGFPEETVYYDIIRAKTAALFAAACAAGAAVSKRSESEIKDFYAYGEAIGMLFQITDDMIDYFSDAETSGKNPGDDFYEGKITLPILYLRQAATPEQRELLDSCFSVHGVRRTEVQLKMVLGWMRDYNIEEQMREPLLRYTDRAKDALEAVRRCDMHAILRDLPHEIINRSL